MSSLLLARRLRNKPRIEATLLQCLKRDAGWKQYYDENVRKSKKTNIAFDVLSKKVEVFDHSHAFFAGGRDHLVNATDQLGIGGHCLASRLPSVDGIIEWNGRIQAIPEFYIHEAMAEAVDVGLPANQRDFCTTFLLGRRERLLRLIQDNRGAFPLIQADQWDQLEGTG